MSVVGWLKTVYSLARHPVGTARYIQAAVRSPRALERAYIEMKVCEDCRENGACDYHYATIQKTVRDSVGSVPAFLRD